MAEGSFELTDYMKHRIEPRIGYEEIEFDRETQNPTPSFLKAILEADHFRERVKFAVRRIYKTEGESGFSVFIRGNKIGFGRLFLGLKRAEDFNELFLGMRRPEVQIFDDIKDYKKFDDDEEMYRRIAVFHFHPTGLGTGFSNEDIKNFDVRNFKDLILNEKHFRKKKKNLFREEDLSLPYIEGLFSFKKNKEKKDKLLLFMIWGKPKSNRYQSIDFSKTSIEDQKRILAEDGFNVILLELPIEKQEVDFSNLDKFIQEHFAKKP